MDELASSGWAIALVITLAVEGLVVLAIAPAVLRRRAAVDSMFANLFTHPLAWLVLGEGALAWGWAELAVFVIEAGVFSWITGMAWWRALVTAGIANGVTAGLAWLW